MAWSYSHRPRNTNDFRDLLALVQANDTSVTGIELRDLFPQNGTTARELGESLAGNTVVSSLSLDLPALLSSELQQVDFIEDSSFYPILQYLRGSTSLRTLCIWAGREENQVVHRILNEVGNVITENTRIKDVLCNIRGTQLHLPTRILSSAPHVEALTVTLFGYDLAPNHHLPFLFVDALRANETLERLVMGIFTPVLPDFLTQCLRRLHMHPKLKTLVLGTSIMPSNAHYDALEHYIRSLTGKPVCLCLSGYHFNQNSERAFAAMAESHMLSVRLSSGSFNPVATEAFVRFVQGIEPSTSRLPRELALGSGVNFEGRGIGHVISDSLSGSGLPCLGLMGDTTMGVLEGLCSNHNKISLKRLNLTELNAQSAVVLGRFLSLTLRLCVLTISSLENDVDREHLFRSIRRNSSLHRIGIPAMESAYGSRMKAVMKRNRKVRKLLARRGDHPGGTVAPLIRFPSLYRAGQEAPQAAPNTMLIGLLADSQEGQVGRPEVSGHRRLRS